MNQKNSYSEEELKKSNTKAEDQKKQIYDLKQNIQDSENIDC